MTSSHKDFWSFDRRQPLARSASEPRSSRAAALRASVPPRTPAPARTPSTPSRLSVSVYFAAQRLKRSSQRASPSSPRAPTRQIMDPRELSGEEGEVDESMEGSPNRGDASPLTRRSPSRGDASPTPSTSREEGSPAPVGSPSRRDQEPPRTRFQCARRADRLQSALRRRGRSRDHRCELRTRSLNALPASTSCARSLSHGIRHLVMAPTCSQRPERRPLLNPSTADYGFRPRYPAEACRQAFQQSLALHTIGPAARTPEELSLRTSMRERLLTPQSTTVAEYRERLRLQAQQKSVPAMRTYPVVLSPGEDSIEYEAQFESWAEHSRKLSSMDALRASFSEVDVRIERELRFDFAKVRAKRSLSALTQPQTQFSAARFAPSSTPAAPSREGVSAVAQGQPRSNVADPAAPQLIAGKRGTAGVPP
ncbi:hypothetical protein PHYSODRAFT_341085 [Phytophthora sojae]|uniref:Uncharacterized protein n=1 Tax=Phytophthora sojae (strain P6497) TaxID=1094619 RepID=G5AC42_PHYSP|nr:hypothetical protein PHYSODRAFT_341085 [Phytophthora sojae]EGZ06917.1 hypothetical protein PHYSODRAFT_341085 [Phytophthora sojae]|eukprot:XP_009537681.1 hypothetical protein PHYSODRAFT_341085 [Phytophthora sojae]